MSGAKLITNKPVQSDDFCVWSGVMVGIAALTPPYEIGWWLDDRG